MKTRLMGTRGSSCGGLTLGGRTDVAVVDLDTDDGLDPSSPASL